MCKPCMLLIIIYLYQQLHIYIYIKLYYKSCYMFRRFCTNFREL